MKINIVDVTLRDGLQNIKESISLEDKYVLLKKICAGGLNRVELGSFVNKKKVPQMTDTPKLVEKALKKQNRGGLFKGVVFSAFVPNQIGAERALASGLKELSTFISCTDAFSKKNINKTVKQSLKELKRISSLVRSSRVPLRVYLSVCFFCPYEGRVKHSQVKALSDQILQIGCTELSISDTVGMAVFSDVEKLLDSLLKNIPKEKIALHFHDTRGGGLSNVVAGLKYGIKVFDAAIGGLGGCPYAGPRVPGNVATEDLAFMLEKSGYGTDVNVPKVLKATHFLEKTLSCYLHSRLSSTQWTGLSLKERRNL